MEAPGRDPEPAGPGIEAGREAGRPAPSRTSPIVLSFIYAWAGLKYLYETQRNMRLHLLIGTLVGAVCIVLGVGRTDVLMVVLAIGGVLLAEVVNTVVESITDLMEPDLDPIAKVVKDVAAAGVLLSAAFSVLIGVIVFVPLLAAIPERLRDFLEARLAVFVVYLVVAVAPAAVGLALPVRLPLRDAGRRR